jgi:hypothetical protein
MTGCELAQEPGSSMTAAALDARAQALARYHELNRGYDRPLVLHLSRRGFFSEVTVALATIIYALAERRRLMVSQAVFNGLSWSDFFDSELPAPDPDLVRLTPPESQLRVIKAEGFTALRAWLKAKSRSQGPIRLEALDVKGGPAEVRRAVCDLFCRPLAAIRREAAAQMRTLGLQDGAFAALHVRRGDKIAVHERKGRLWAEGEDTPPAHCLDLVRQAAPELRDLFVLTDDHRAVEELRATCGAMRVVSLCREDQGGHHQADFNAQPPEEKTAAIRRLLVEVEIATRSGLFAGGFKSNLACFVADAHGHPERCISTDARQPGWTF